MRTSKGCAASVMTLVAMGAALSANACEVSLPASIGLPDWLEASEGFVWVGSPKLAAQVPKDGHWVAMGAEHNYRDKWWWWREGYRAVEETQPQLMILANRLDAPAPPVVIERATNAIFAPGRDQILTGMEFPTAGCWDVFASYRGEELRFIFKVGE